MQTPADKTSENKSHVLVEESSEFQSAGEYVSQFAANHPNDSPKGKFQIQQANSQGNNWQEMANNSPQARQAAQLQAMVNTSQSTSIPKKENQTGLPDRLKSGIENLSGYSMNDVNVHYNSSKPAQLKAFAYAQGTDIHVAPGQEQHLPHEAWHVVQQKQGRVKPTKQLKARFPINDDKILEREADQMGKKAMETGEKASSTAILQEKSTDSNTIQGKFGFELELTIAVEADLGGGNYADPKRTKGIGIHLGRGNLVELHVDHQETKAMIGSGVVDDRMFEKGEGAPIIEIVTDPLDEFDDNIDAQIITLTQELDTIQQGLLAARGNRTPLNSIIGGADPRLVVGGAKSGRQNTKSYTHATYGVKLSEVTDSFREHADTITAQRGGDSPRAANLMKAVTAAEEISDWMFDTYKDRTKGVFRWKDLNRYDIHDQEDMNKIKGLLTLLGNYKITYTRTKGKLMKNQVGVFFYKSKLNELVAHLSEKQQTLLTKRSKKIADHLIEKCVEERGSDLEERVDWRAWIREVLKGNNDRILIGAKNPYSPKLGPDQLGPEGDKEAGVVMENRYISELLQGVGKKIAPADWPDMVRGVKDMLVQTNTSQRDDA